MMMEVLMRRIEVKKDTLTFINSSKGAYIEGAIHMPFTEAIEKYVPVENVDFERLIKECPDSFSLEGKENIEKVMQSYVEECEKIYDNYEQCHQLYAQLKNENSIDNIQKAMQTIDELYVKSEKCFTGRLIADASSMEADTVLEAMYKESTNQEKCSKEYLGSVADKGMQMADIFMKNARKTEELFKESIKSMQ